jgi:sugar transferase (PEP-CTERM/EpsH1 system associated)
MRPQYRNGVSYRVTGTEMNLLVVCPHFPECSSGAPTRCYHLIRALTREHDVSLLVLRTIGHEKRKAHPPQGLQLQQYAEVALGEVSWAKKRLKQVFWILKGRSPSIEKYRSKEIQEELDTLFVKQHYEGCEMAAGYRLPRSTQVIIDEHNVEYELLYRMYQSKGPLIWRWYKWWESRQMRAAELRCWSQSRGVLVTSTREASLIKLSLPNAAVHVVPNGVDLENFRDADNACEIGDHIVFTGAMDYYPNIDAVLHFARECWPVIRSKAPHVTWAIVGRNPPSSVLKLGNVPGITVTGSVPDVRPYLAAATVAIVPLRIGSGTRLKILEAFAMKKAVVSTSLGCEGIDVVPGVHLLMVDQPEAFAQCVVDLLQDQARRAALGSAGRELARAYSWRRVGDALVDAVETITTEIGVCSR